MSLAEEAPISPVPEFHLGDRLRKARVLADLDQRDMAEAFGVSNGTISNWEAGTVQPRNLLKMVDRWSSLTGVSAAWILTGSNRVSSWDQIIPVRDASSLSEQLRLNLLTSVR